MIEQLPAMLDLWQATLQWQPGDRQLTQFQKLYEAIIIGNRKHNLTRITTPEDFWEKHLWDSLLGVAILNTEDKLAIPDSPRQVIDIGTGAGFPGLPVAIANPDWKLTLVDSTHKKIAFVEKTIAQLGLKNLYALVERAETIGRDPHYRESYDLALIRAVGKPSVCAEYILPLVKVGGLAILYRGHWEEEDTFNLESAVSELGSKIELIHAQKTPITESIRHCIYLRKHSPIAHKYPRAVGVPNQKPL
ncbi:16S rRNA (guanine(527)-N(7))-methyltransferase RsmG [Xenococcus sp. PCC 7305]|uniref:16S rRNA (guanine(527)-N(7))-methyltransferase RsmG n=1 Tax=Xenococcus sp. PCC 7305 TaxID=102125 RepID=UPI0002FAA665|nr:16S rRNA (guanine(527)-N(7))-methyltransferase RsmG [Xenococcus sp. PCC 7305]